MNPPWEFPSLRTAQSTAWNVTNTGSICHKRRGALECRATQLVDTRHGLTGKPRSGKKSDGCSRRNGSQSLASQDIQTPNAERHEVFFWLVVIRSPPARSLSPSAQVVARTRNVLRRKRATATHTTVPFSNSTHMHGSSGHNDPSRVCQLARHLVKNTLAVRHLAELHGLCCCGATLHDLTLELVPPGSPSLIAAAARRRPSRLPC